MRRHLLAHEVEPLQVPRPHRPAVPPHVPRQRPQHLHLPSRVRHTSAACVDRIPAERRPHLSFRVWARVRRNAGADLSYS